MEGRIGAVLDKPISKGEGKFGRMRGRSNVLELGSQIRP